MGKYYEDFSETFGLSSWADLFGFEIAFWLYLIVTFLALLSFVLTMFRQKKTRKGKHDHYIRQAGRSLAKIRSIKLAPQKLTYLRKLNPYVFEEMVLTAIDSYYGTIKRSDAYSGDGGIDGRCYINRVEVLIQSKCYDGYISAQHVKDFIEVCYQYNRPGLFVHTGKTGRLAKRYFESRRVALISGEQLISLLEGSDFSPRFK